MANSSASHEHPSARVLVIEENSDLRELEQIILSDDGYSVEAPPDQANPAEFAVRSHPDVIVLGIAFPQQPRSWQVLDQLQANPQTRTIPVVIVSTSETATAQAQAAPVVGSIGNTVVAPYDISTLEEAVASALQNPPPAATLPQTTYQPSKAEEVAGNALNANGRQIAVRTIEGLRGIEPYASRFVELTKGLVDDVGMMLGTIADGLLRGIPPRTAFHVPVIRQSIDRHVKLRETQGLGLGANIEEYRALQDEIDRYLQGLVGQQGFTSQDAHDVSAKVHRYIAELVRIIGEDYAKTK